MITVTEFSGNLLRTAAKAVPPVKKAEAPKPAEAPAAEAAPAADAPAADAAPAEKPAEAAPAPAPAASPEAAVLDPERVKAVCTALSVDEARASRLLEALFAVGNRLERVRQVRVVKPEGAPTHGVKVGEHVFLVDLLESAGKGDRDDRRGGRGGPRKGGGRPGGKPGDKKDESLTGRFSMDSLKEDRRGQGRPGGGGGGGRGPRRGPPGPGGGAPAR